jgi:hypothetical protein
MIPRLETKEELEAHAVLYPDDAPLMHIEIGYNVNE